MANDKERMFLFSLMVMGGSALTIADQYDTMGNSAWVYQNTELLKLNEMGFVAKPLSYDLKNIEKSSVWAGQLPNGDWVVGFFNRENTKQPRSIDFERELGITGSTVANIRDLWQHADLGKHTGGYSVELDPHECRIIKIENNSLKYEAEFASMIKTRKSTSNFMYSGNGYVTGFEHGGSVLITVDVPATGEYSLDIRYGNSSGKSATGSLYINDKKHAEQLNMPDLKNGSDWETILVNISLQAGTNFVSIQKDEADNGLFNLDFIQINNKKQE
jgi:hypothetical protein